MFKCSCANEVWQGIRRLEQIWGYHIFLTSLGQHVPLKINVGFAKVWRKIFFAKLAFSTWNNLEQPSHTHTHIYIYIFCLNIYIHEKDKGKERLFLGLLFPSLLCLICFPALFRCVSIFEAQIFTVEFARGLKDVQEIQSNDRAFAVIMSNGTVASWGIGDAGGDSSEVQDLLKDVRHIQVGCVFFGCLVVGSFGCGGHKWGWFMVVSNILFFIFTSKVGGNEAILTNIFQRGWNHQLVSYVLCEFLRWCRRFGKWYSFMNHLVWTGTSHYTFESDYHVMTCHESKSCGKCCRKYLFFLFFVFVFCAYASDDPTHPKFQTVSPTVDSTTPVSQAAKHPPSFSDTKKI